jgi:uncharacterized coiled-coil protein SlyX
MTAYKQNLSEGATASVEAHPVGVAIRQLLEKQNEWSGEPAQLLQTLNALVSDEQRDARNWPQNVRSLGHCLRRLASALRRAGIAYERGKGMRRTIPCAKPAKKRLDRLKRRATAQQKTIKTFPTIFLRHCTIRVYNEGRAGLVPSNSWLPAVIE